MKFYNPGSILSDVYSFVAKMRYVFHPARFFTPPNEDAFALLAGRNYKKGELVDVYGGRMWEAKNLIENGPEHTDLYAYDLNHDMLKALGYKGPRLVVENRWEGNTCGFVNDKFCRERADESVNVEAVVMWDARRKLPVVVFCTTRAVKREEELVVDYGDGYWKVVWKRLSKALTAHWAEYEPKCSILKRELNEFVREEAEEQEGRQRKTRAGVRLREHFQTQNAQVSLPPALAPPTFQTTQELLKCSEQLSTSSSSSCSSSSSRSGEGTSVKRHKHSV